MTGADQQTAAGSRRRSAKPPKSSSTPPLNQERSALEIFEEVQGALILDSRGAIRPCEASALPLLAADPKIDGLHHDEFLNRLRIDGRDWGDNDDCAALIRTQIKYKVHGFTLSQIRTALRTIAYGRRRDSLREYLDAVPAWDGTSRIALAFSDAWGAPDDPLTRAASSNFFIALIARALKPGAQVDTLWVFEGKQGTYKSLSLRRLGGSFHAEITASIGTPDFLRELRGIWIAELSELDSLHGKEASTVKRILSAPSDRFVEKYQTHAATYQRRAVAVATTNEAHYWQDSTGARRLVPIKTGEIRLDVIEANREQWFAEALHAYKAGASWWEFPVTIAVAQDERQQVDPWEDALRGMITSGRQVHGGGALSPPVHVPWPDGWIASAEIMGDWLRLALHQQAQNSATRLGRIMRRLGYVPARYGKNRERGWTPAQVETVGLEATAETAKGLR